MLSHTAPYLRFFRQRGHEVVWLAYDKPNHDYGVPTYDISHGANAKVGRTKWRYLLAGLSLGRLAPYLNLDIVHGHYATSAGIICMLAGCRPYVITAHGSDLIRSMNSPIWRPILRRSLSGAACVNPVSEELACYARTLGVPDERLLVATLGVDTRFFVFAPRARLSQPVKLLCTRALGEVYDPATIVGGCRVLRREGVDFTMTFAATGPLQSGLQRLAEDYGIRDRVVFLGGYDNTTLPDLLRRHDIYVSASLWDGTSISLLEAMSAGIYPVISRIASNKAWCDETAGPMMFECGDVEGFAAAVMAALSDEEMRQAVLARNRRVIEDRGDRDKNMLLLEGRFLEIAGSR